MKKIANPLLNESVEEIYNTLVESYKEDEKRKLGKTYKPDVIDYSNEYKIKMPKDYINFHVKPASEEEKKFMVALYKNRMVAERVGGYYDIIKMGAHGTCPFCGCGSVKTLDHYLPKSLYPILAVTPYNLVPSCSACNENKKTYNPQGYDELIIHPYFEEVDEQWLNAKVSFYNDKSFDIEYYVSPFLSDKKLEKRLNKHLEVCGLQDTFQDKAATVLHSMKAMLKNMASSGKTELRDYVRSNYESAYESDCNTWYAAMTWALFNQVDDLYNWLLI